jgi:diadenylate cyclase
MESIIYAFRAIRFMDIMDIFVIYVIFYYLIRLLQETKTMQMLKGFVMLLIAALAAKFMELHTISWVIENVWAVLITAFIILFQPELRQILVDIGQRKIRFKALFKTEEDVYDELVETCRQMLKRRIGALIILEKEVGLKEYIDTGVKINSDLSAAILMTIFTPKTPLHDGAVIINHGKIVAAGCVLPLSQKKDIDIELGMRHRAALGITEETDAIAIIISEDLRHVSLSQNGRITPVDLNNLKEMLVTYASKKI